MLQYTCHRGYSVGTQSSNHSCRRAHLAAEGPSSRRGEGRSPRSGLDEIPLAGHTVHTDSVVLVAMLGERRAHEVGL